VIPHSNGFRLLDSLVGELNSGAYYETMGTLEFVGWYGQVTPISRLELGMTKPRSISLLLRVTMGVELLSVTKLGLGWCAGILLDWAV